MIFKANFYDERFIVGIYIHTQWLHNNFDLEEFFAEVEKFLANNENVSLKFINLKLWLTAGLQIFIIPHNFSSFIRLIVKS